MNSKILIVEDKSILAHDIVDRLEQFGYKNIIGPFPTAEEALTVCERTSPDIAILDIELKGKMDGIELGKKLNENGDISIIYLTNQQDDRIFNDSMQTYPAAFINKPFTNSELKMALINASRPVSGSISHSVQMPISKKKLLNDRVFVRNGRGKLFIKLEDILWIRSAGGDTSSIMTKDRLESDPKLLPVVGYSLSKVEEKLGFYPYLIRASRFFIVNLKQVDRILDVKPSDRTTPRKVLLIANNEIVVGDKYRKNLMERFHII